MAEKRYLVVPQSGLYSKNEAEIQAFSSILALPKFRAPGSFGNLSTFGFSNAPEYSASCIQSTSVADIALVRLSEKAADAINNNRSIPLRVFPEVLYPEPEPPWPTPSAPDILPADIGIPVPTKRVVTVSCMNAITSDPVKGCKVAAFTDYKNNKGDYSFTDSDGIARIKVDRDATIIEVLYAHTNPGLWGFYQTDISITERLELLIEPVGSGWTDAVRTLVNATGFDLSIGIKVGVLDTGVSPHVELNIIGGVNTVPEEEETDIGDPRGHGSHVAGIIGSKGIAGSWAQGIAPGVAIRAYRVFPLAGGTTNFSIVKAIAMAIKDGCDIINLSFAGGPYDKVIDEAITEAYNNGVLPIAAAGNNFRSSPEYPAAYTDCIAVSNMGVRGAFPENSIPNLEVNSSPVTIQNDTDFIALSSAIGEEVDFTAPGVGIVSTLPDNGYGQMSGTSMSAPVVTGCLATLLSENPNIYHMPKNRARALAMTTLLSTNATNRGFSLEYVGAGFPNLP